MPQQTIADLLRPAAKRWAETAPLMELAACLPARLLFRSPVGQAAPPTAPTAPQSPAPRPKKRRRRKGLSQKAKKLIQDRLGGIKVGTPEYLKVRNQLVKELGVKPRQIGAYVAQLKPAASRRKRK